MHRQLIMEFPTEEWRPVKDYEGWYEVSSKGRVRRVAPGPGTQVGRLMAGSKRSTGYPGVRLYKDGIYWSCAIHNLVAEAFLGPRPEGLVVNHKDGNKANNSVENLEYVTYKENIHHSMHVLGAVDRIPRGEANKNSKLTESAVLGIRRDYAAGQTNKSELGRKYGITGDHVRNIVTRKFWKHVA